MCDCPPLLTRRNPQINIIEAIKPIEVNKANAKDSGAINSELSSEI